MTGLDGMAILFWLFAIVTCAGALVVVLSRHIVRAAMGLILSLFGVAMLFLLAGAEFVGAMQLMIYVGGTVVLLAFGVMLTARRPLLQLSTTRDQWLVAVLLACPLTVILVQAALSYAPTDSVNGAVDQQTDEVPTVAIQPVTPARLGMALLGFRQDDHSHEREGVSHGDSGYLLPFELISVHLLAVLIGAAYLARREVPSNGARSIANHRQSQ